MLYLAEARASMERGNKINGEKGPGPIFAKLVEPFSSGGLLREPNTLTDCPRC